MATTVEIETKVANWLEDVDRQSTFINGRTPDGTAVTTVTLRNGTVLKTLPVLVAEAQLDITAAEAARDEAVAAATSLSMSVDYIEMIQDFFQSGSSDFYAWKVQFSGGQVPFGISRQGDMVINGQTQAVYQSPTIVDAYSFSSYGHWIGQSLCTGRKSIKPDDLFAAMTAPVIPGRAVMFGTVSPRIKGTDSDTQVASRAPSGAFYVMGDAKEGAEGIAGATSAWAFLQSFGAYDSARMEAVTNTGVGGTNTDAIRGIAPASRMATNRRAAILAYAQVCRTRGITPFYPAYMVFDQGNADRTFTYAKRRANLEGLFFDEFTKEVIAAGADNQDIWLILGACAEIYASGSPCSDIHDVPLDMARIYPNVCVWGPEYILETALGALRADEDYPSGAVPAAQGDLLHLAAIGQARKGFYQELYFEKMLSGAKVLPLHVNIGTRDAPVTGNATVTAGGLVTLTYENWRATNLVLDTSFVTDPGGNLPYGYGFAPGVGSGSTSASQPAPSTTIRPRASSFNAIGTNTLRFQLENIADGTNATPGANPRIIVANYWNGTQQGGPDRGARACLRNNGAADTRTIGSYSFVLHDYAMPETIPLALV